MSEYKNIIVEKKSFTGIITIDREEVYGALSKEAKLEIIQAIRTLNRDDEVGCLILASKGKGFCTGQDLNDRTVQAGEKPVDLGVTLETEWNPLVNAISNSKKLVIAAIEGVVAGAGVSVALACDLVIAKPGIKFVSGFSKLGLCPDAGSTFTFTRALGQKKAMEFFLFNQPLLSEDMERAGLINKVSEEAFEDAKKWADQINAMAPLSLKAIKENIKVATDSTFQESMDRETSYQRFLGNSEDYKEGLNAFFEKRQAKFLGK
ncbi:putative enoyl-CoA hydratase PaaG [Halobacteriovorax sp. BALOs_7]|uniref:enoyl-CoA hydratase/isomerase family protein n=1 Tax=Halobacteriovorax sp. BALOs_7 TaxID=2109558 RepID=UPI000EA0083B|nr:enoyl-CoA hydratase-related protein [Halobacteriovorax sp. BALOs_7]AYF44958.1 putative enoyl-CoA hydratase PaaG [Halobacteriovorax sp. BALOs_7]